MLIRPRLASVSLVDGKVGVVPEKAGDHRYWRGTRSQLPEEEQFVARSHRDRLARIPFGDPYRVGGADRLADIQVDPGGGGGEQLAGSGGGDDRAEPLENRGGSAEDVRGERGGEVACVGAGLVGGGGDGDGRPGDVHPGGHGCS